MIPLGETMIRKLNDKYVNFSIFYFNSARFSISTSFFLNIISEKYL